MIFSPIIGLLFFISFASGCQEFPLGLDRILEQDALLAAIISPSSCTHSPLLTKNSQHLFLNELASPSTLSQAMLLVKKVIVDLSDQSSTLIIDYLWQERFRLPASHKYIFIGTHIDTFNQEKLFRFFKAEFIIPNGTFFQVLHRHHPFSTHFVSSKTKQSQHHRMNLLDFSGLPLRASAFPFKPYSDLDFETGNHGGFEYNIAAVLAKALNLKLHVHLPADGEWWGQEMTPNNYSGMLGELQKEVADIGWGNLYDTLIRHEFMSFTNWYTIDTFCAMVPRAEFYPKVRALTLPFGYKLWICFAAMVATCLLLLTIYASLGLTIQEASLSKLLVYFAAITLSQSQDLTFKFRANGLRIAVFFTTIVLFILAIAYSGALISVLTVKVSPTSVNTLGELLKGYENGEFTLNHCCPDTMDALKAGQSEVNQKLATVSELQIPYKNKEYILEVAQGKTAAFDTKNKLIMFEQLYLSSGPGTHTGVHIVEECFSLLPIGLGLQKNSPYSESMNIRMQALEEAGIIAKIMKDNAEEIGQTVGSKAKVAQLEALTLAELQGIIIIWGILLACSVILFGIETLRALKMKWA